MPSRRPYKTGSGGVRPRAKQWAARRKRDGKECFIGYYFTEAEARAAEEAFDKVWERLYA